MKKKLLGIVLSLCMLTAFIPCAYSAEITASGNCGANGDNVTWTLDSEGVLTISGTGDMSDWTSISSVPWYKNKSDITQITMNKGITSIGNNAFYDLDNIKNMLSMPDTITRIGKYAFANCGALISASIGSGVTLIDDSAFRGCSKLNIVYTYSSNLTTIGDDAFCFCYALQNIKIPNTVTSIGDAAFQSCSYLSNITIPENITHIGKNAFYGDRLKTADIPSCTEYIGEGAFTGNKGCVITVDENNEHFSSLDGVLFNKDKTELIAYTMGAENLENGIYVVPDGVKTIKASAFHNLTQLNGITLPESLITLEDAAFRYANLKTELFIPKNVANIGSSVFDYASIGFRVDEGNENFSSEDGVLFSKDKTKLIAFPSRRKDTSYIIPDGTVTIDAYAFSSGDFTQIGIPDSIVSIGNAAFLGCNSLSDVYYSGGETDWNNIDISTYGGNNSKLINAAKHYNSTLILTPTVPPEPTIQPSPTPLTTPAPLPFTVDGNKVTNTTAEEQNATVIIVTYNQESGAMDTITSEKKTFKPNNTAVFQNLTNNFRIFVWDSIEKMRPLNK